MHVCVHVVTTCVRVHMVLKHACAHMVPEYACVHLVLKQARVHGVPTNARVHMTWPQEGKGRRFVSMALGSAIEYQKQRQHTN